MIGFALPWMLGAGAVAVVAIAALHFLSVRQPQELVLPTARFLIEREVRAVSRTRRPSDLLLLLLRIAALLCVSLAAADAWWHRARSTRLNVIVADGDVLDDTLATRALVRAATADSGISVIAFVATERTHALTANRANVVAVFPVAWRVAAKAIAENPSINDVALHVLLSRAAVIDSATNATDGVNEGGWRAWRATWPGRVVVHRPATYRDTLRRLVIVDGDSVHHERSADDPVRSALAMYAARWSHVGATKVDTVIVYRGDAPLNTRRSLGVLSIRWPISGVPSGWRPTRDDSSNSALAFASGGRAVMGPWRIPSELVAEDSGSDTTARGIVPIAWWSDGRVAAVEHGLSCTRDVAVQVQHESDVLLSDGAMPLFAMLLAPCRDSARLSPALLINQVVVTVDGARNMATADVFRAARGEQVVSDRGWLAPGLLLMALALLLVESRLRARSFAESI